MAGFLPTILPALDAIRAIGGMLGLRVFTIKVRKRVWSGARPGLGTKTDTDTVLTVQGADGKLYPVRVSRLNRRDAIASGNKFVAGDLKVGPMTPAYAAALGLSSAGFDDGTFDPAVTASPTELIWMLTTNDGGTHGVSSGGSVCEKIGEEATALHYIVFLRSTGRQIT